MSVALDLSRLRRRLSSPAPAAATSAPQATGGVPSLIDSRYRIDEMIGRGGMGAVYRAHDLRLGRDVAVKVVRSDLAGRVEARQRFEREAQIVARLQHPAIVTVFDYGTLPDGAAFLVMEYVRGLDLRRLLDREGPLAADRVVPLVETIARAVDSAHQAGVLHRDLKPENILLPESGLAAKVLDFGVAKLVDGDPARAGTVTHAATIIGTPAYMAPEQLRGAPIDGRADVYSLAVMTYEALTGRLPFGAGSIIDIGLNQAAGRGRVDLTGIPEGMTAPLLAGLAATPEERPADAIAFATALAAPPRPR
jgi:serine/threonine-protein kinase